MIDEDHCVYIKRNKDKYVLLFVRIELLKAWHDVTNLEFMIYLVIF